MREAFCHLVSTNFATRLSSDKSPARFAAPREALYRYFSILILLLGAGPALATEVKYSYERDIKSNVDIKGVKHWRQWRDQHSTIWLSNEWRPDSNTCIKVSIYKTPGALLGKAGEQSVVKMTKGRQQLYCSDTDKPDPTGPINPVYIRPLPNNKIAIVSVPRLHALDVFQYKGGKIVKVLSTSSRFEPEFINDGDLRDFKPYETKIILTDFPNEDLGSKIYRWSPFEGKYQVKSAPCNKRFAEQTN